MDMLAPKPRECTQMFQTAFPRHECRNAGMDFDRVKFTWKSKDGAFYVEGNEVVEYGKLKVKVQNV